MGRNKIRQQSQNTCTMLVILVTAVTLITLSGLFFAKQPMFTYGYEVQEFSQAMIREATFHHTGLTTEILIPVQEKKGDMHAGYYVDRVEINDNDVKVSLVVLKGDVMAMSDKTSLVRILINASDRTQLKTGRIQVDWYSQDAFSRNSYKTYERTTYSQ